MQLESISRLRVLWEIVTDPTPLPPSSSTHIMSPTLNVWLETLFVLTDDVVPLPYFGLFP